MTLSRARTHQSWDNLSKQPPRFLEHALSAGRDAIWKNCFRTLKTLEHSERCSLGLTLNCDRIVGVTGAGCRTVPCCGKHERERTSRSAPHCAPRAPSSTVRSRPANTSRSFGGGGWEEALVGRSCCSKTKAESFEPSSGWILCPRGRKKGEKKL